MSKLVSDFLRVAVLLPTAIKTCREMLRGVLRYTSLHGPWDVQIIEGREGEQKLSRFSEWGCTGVIGNFYDSRFAHYLSRMDVPVVSIDPEGDAGPPPSRIAGFVVCDNAPIGRAAARYFVERGFDNFAFVGEVNGYWWSVERQQAYTETLKAHGHDCETYVVPSGSVQHDAGRERRHLAAWLAGLKKPVALFVAFDMRARQVLDECRKAGIAVPQDVAVLSCDNDELICETAVPQLSSIQMADEQAGFDAARLLDMAMRGQLRRRKTPLRVSYGFADIVTRASSEYLQLKDPLVERALSCIRLNGGVSFTVNDLAKQLSVSRRLLELHFRHALGRTIHDEIVRVRIDRAKNLLRTTASPIEELASMCGFASASHLCSVFKRRTGVTPFAFRRKGEAAR